MPYIVSVVTERYGDGSCMTEDVNRKIETIEDATEIAYYIIECMDALYDMGVGKKANVHIQRID